MKTELLIENSASICYEFYQANSVEEKRAIGNRLLAYVQDTTHNHSGFVQSMLSPVLQLHVDTFERTHIKLQPNNLLNIVENFYEKEKAL